MFGNLGSTELILIVLIFMGLVGVVFLFLRRSDKAEASLLRQRPSIVMTESPSTAANLTPGEARVKGPDEKFCQECGSLIRANAEICPRCGVRQATGLPMGKSRGIFIILGILLGLLGIHNFYAGYYGRGTSQLILTVTLSWLFYLGAIITGVWVVIELITVKVDADGNVMA